MNAIPFNRPTIIGKELYYISQAIHNGHSAGDGDFTKKCQRLLEQAVGAQKVLLTTSCTDALEMAALLLDIRPGDEVIVPTFTFVSTANAFVLRGATPVFADIRPDTLNLDERRLERLITPRTRAIVPVHYAGVGCEMDSICEIAARRGVPVVEDNAHGLFGKYKGRNLGSFGALSTLSFHETKNFICGEGGALVLNDFDYWERAEILREKGTNRSRFFRGEVDKYTWVDTGSSYLPSDLLAAFLYAQLEARAEIQARRRQIWNTYNEQLRPWANANGVELPSVPPYCEHPFHMYYIVLPTAELRNALIEHLKLRGIMAVFHYLPLNLSPMGRKLGGRKGLCPVAEDISERVLRLPFYNNLTEADQQRVVESLSALPMRGRLAAGAGSVA
jgi:dTDP-4-amino-4,6-dideoxygalactose transaminase